jgi:hypothetical protein
MNRHVAEIKEEETPRLNGIKNTLHLLIKHQRCGHEVSHSRRQKISIYKQGILKGKVSLYC